MGKFNHLSHTLFTIKPKNMNEWFSANYENNQKNKEVENSFLNSPENQVREQYLKYQNINWARELATSQIKENQNLKQNLETQVQNETKESLDKEAMINEAKTMLYEKLWIDNNQNNNSSFEKFQKWIIDTLILDNYDLAIQVWETNWKVILDSLKQLASFEWLKKMAESIWESIWNLLSWNAYERWKSVAELWLITTWAWAWVYIWKKWFKLWMKEMSRLRKPAERVVEGREVKSVISETRWKIDKIVPKKQLDFEKALVEDIDKLWDKERLKAASFYLKKELTPEHEKAVLEAHNVWLDREGAWIYNYNQAEISEKVRILKDAWFSKEERKVLLEKWVCWKNIEIMYNTLYEDPNYIYLNNPKYRELREVLWTIWYNDIVWEWNNWLILPNPDTSKVIKIAKEWNVDKLEIEFSNHVEFRKWLLQLQEEFRKKVWYEFIQKFDIPTIDRFHEVTWIYEMQRVNWLSLKTIITLDYYKSILWDLPKDFFNKMTDNQVERFLLEKWLKVYPNNLSEINKLWWNFSDRSFMVDLERLWENSLKKDIDPVMKLLRERWYMHNDEHWWNFMKTPEWKIFIIDFWRSNVPKPKNNF